MIHTDMHPTSAMPEPPFTILARGTWTRDQVRLRQVSSTRRIDPNVETAIENAWAQATAGANRLLFDGPMCRVEHFHFSSDAVSMDWSPTSFRVFFGTNLRIADAPAPMPLDTLASPIGVSTALLSRDGFLLFGRRNARVAYHPNRVHPFAGSLEPAEAHDPFAAPERELQEELHLQRDDLSDIRLIGLVQDRSLRQPELVFAVRSRRSLSDITKRLDPAEHAGVRAVAIGQIDAARRDPVFTPVAQAVLQLCQMQPFCI